MDPRAPDCGAPPEDPAGVLLAQQAFLRRLARGLVHGEADAEDLVQDAVLLALRQRDAAPSRAWLATALRRLAASGHRARGRRAAREARAARREALESHAAAIDRRLDLQATVAELLLRLPDAQARALALRYAEDLPPGRIAARLGVPEATVKARLRRGLARLRAELDARHGGRRELWAAALLPIDRPAAAAGAAGAAAAGLAAAAVIALALTLHALGARPAPGAPLAAPEDAPPTRPEERAAARAVPPRALPAGSARAGRAVAGAGQPPAVGDAARGAAPGVPVEETGRGAAADHEPFLSMRFERGARAGGFLRVRIVGEEDTAPSGALAFEVAGLPRREVELRGGSDPEARRVELRVPALAEVTVRARLDGLLAEPQVVRAPADGAWLDVRLPVAMDPRAAHLALALQGDRDLEGRAFLVRLECAPGATLERALRAPTVEGGRLVVGGLPPGRVRLVAHEQDAVEGGRTSCRVIVAEAHLDPGERALLPARAERSGTVRVTARAPDGAPLEARVRARPRGGAPYRASFRSAAGWATALVHADSLLVPPLPPGPATLRFESDGRAPLEREVWIRAGEVAELVVELAPR